MKRRFLSLLLCLLMVFALPISSHAITGTSEGIVTYGQSKPSKAWNWSDGAYQFSGHGICLTYIQIIISRVLKSLK